MVTIAESRKKVIASLSCFLSFFSYRCYGDTRDHEIKYGTSLRVAGRVFLIFYILFPVPNEFCIFFILSMCVLYVIVKRLFSTPTSQIFLTIFDVHTRWQNSQAYILYMWQKKSFVKKATLPLSGHKLNWEKPLVCMYLVCCSRDFANLYQSRNVILCL